MSTCTILVAKVRQRSLDYVKNLQVKYFTGKNIPIYSMYGLIIASYSSASLISVL